MTEFVGRAEQLGFLDAILAEVRNTGTGRMVSIRGRRQIGKSRLIEEFIKRRDLSAVFYTASRETVKREFEFFTEAVAESTLRAGDLARSGELGSWEAALTLLGSEATQDRPVVIVFDEFPYLVESGQTSHAIEGMLQKLWDRQLDRQPVLLVLIGSDLTTMAALSEYGRPLFGRSREMVVPPLSPAEIGEMLKLEPVDAFDAYLIIGGYPRLASLWRKKESCWRFLPRMLNDASSPLLVLAERSLNAEFPSDIQAQRVLNAIGHDERAFKAIGKSAGVKDATLALALSRLETKGVIEKTVPYSTFPSSKSPRYYVKDPYLRFWLRFLGSAIELLDRGRPDLVIERIRKSFNDYRGRAIEPIVRRSIEQMLPDERFGDAHFVGSFWTRDNRIEIDLVGGRELDHSKTIDFVGSIKWREKATFNRADSIALMKQQAVIPGADENTRTVGVSRSGFDRATVDVQLGPDDLLAAWVMHIDVAPLHERIHPRR